MKLREHLDLFYHQFNIPAEGGVHDKTFKIPFPLFTLTLPNFAWRKRMLFIHDLEHIVNKQDTTWAGEIFIASWEISTGYFQNFPILIFPLWTMGWGLWKEPSAVYRGFTKGYSDKGIARLNLQKEQLLQMELPQLELLILNKRANRSRFKFVFTLFAWIVLSQLLFLFPLIFALAWLFLL